MTTKRIFISASAVAFVSALAACSSSNPIIPGTLKEDSGLAPADAAPSDSGGADATVVSDGSIDGGAADGGGADGSVSDATVVADARAPDASNVDASADGSTVDAAVDAAPPPTFTIGGTLVKVLENDLVLQQSGGPDLVIAAGATSFAFPAKVAAGGAYSVSIRTMPQFQQCSVSSGSGTVGSADVSNIVIDCSPKATCKSILTAFPAASSGVNYIDLDGAAGAMAPFKAQCDFGFDGGGWTLIESFSNLDGPDKVTESAEVLPGTSHYLPTATMQLLATLSSQVHLRTAGAAATDSITSTANSEPIANLRQGLLANQGLYGLSGADQASRWTGPLADESHLSFSCPISGGYPAFYWACGNVDGLHVTSNVAVWRWQGGSPANNLNLEIYLR